MEITVKELLELKRKYFGDEEDDIYWKAVRCAEKLQFESLSMELKKKSPLQYISQIGQMYVKEMGKKFGDFYFVDYKVSYMGQYSDMIILYLMCAMDKVNLNFPYGISLYFDRFSDRECFENKLKEIANNFYEKGVPINEVKCELT